MEAHKIEIPISLCYTCVERFGIEYARAGTWRINERRLCQLHKEEEVNFEETLPSVTFL